VTLTLYTDGSIISNPGGAGGWAAILVSGNAHRIRSGSEYDTTNNRMEMQAAIEGLRGLGREVRTVTVVSDSEYLVKGFTEGRLEKMAASDFRKKGKLVKNHDLWESLNELDLRHDLTWTHQAGEHRKAEGLGGAEKYMALAHSFALSEARIAHICREIRLEGVRVPETLQARESLIEILKELPDPPDPPRFEGKSTYAVYQRVGSPGKFLFRGPIFIPMMGESYTDEDTIKDGGRWECQKAATTMSKTDSTKEGVRYRDWRIPRYVVMRYGLVPTEIKKQTGACYHQMTQEQYDRERKEAGEDDGILRAVPGGRAGGRITGSTRVG